MTLLDVSSLPEVDRYSLRAYRRAVEQIYRFWWPHRTHEFTATFLVAGAPNDASLIPDAEFRALVMAVRLVYMPNEPSRFDRIADILGTVKDEDIRTGIQVAKSMWTRALDSLAFVAYQTNDQIFLPRKVMETWFYALALHQDQNKEADAERLRVMDPMPSMTLQLTVMELAIASFNLDNALAYAMGESGHDGESPPRQRRGSGIF